MLDAAGTAVHAMRDPTRGGLASTLNEIATSSGVGVAIDEPRLPVRTEVQSACELLGLDPVYVANEGKAVFFVAPEAAEACWRSCAHIPWAATPRASATSPPNTSAMLVARTSMGSNRVIPIQIGDNCRGYAEKQWSVICGQ